MAFLGTLFSGGDIFWVHVECAKCGERIVVRVDKSSELEFDNGEGKYKLHKDILGKKCNNLIRVELEFDRNYEITASEISNGKFISRIGYEGK